MANQSELKEIALARIETVSILIKASDWSIAGYMMGYVLECALKSVICKTLHLTEYPNKTKDDEWFLTHRLERLLRLSGMEDIFGASGKGFYVWSQFTQPYEGEWTSMRYDPKRQALFTNSSILQLFSLLTGTKSGEEGIITIITNERRW